ncbi:unnamed protein product [Mytilus coruscus]|uniref:G-protein coupled receptors family 1 profile domain-containing protein n=1 Tax=Mytilus coruscus TaxID=42192 RepID=A0A6J8AX69_MYTCO|nr:unnamed protein product [Mytilus coruscus]
MNNSTDSLVSLKLYDMKMANVLLPNTLLLLVGCCLAMLGNTVVMHIHWRKLNSSENFRMFIPFLALSDFVGSVVCTSISVIQNFYWFTWSDPSACKATWILTKFVQSTSVTFLVAIACQRFVRICRPFKQEISRFTNYLFFICAIIFVLFESVPFALFADSFEHRHYTDKNVTFYECRRYTSTHNNYPTIRLVYRIIEHLLHVLLVIIIVVLYFKSGLKLARVAKKITNSKHTRRKTTTTVDFVNDTMDENSVTNGRSLFYTLPSSSTNDITADDASVTTMNYGTTNRAYRKMQAKNQKYKRINCMFIIVSIIVMVTYLPRIVMSFFDVADEHFWYNYSFLTEFTDQNVLAKVSVYRLYMVSFFINPVVYSVMDLEFRKSLKLCCYHCLHSD